MSPATRDVKLFLEPLPRSWECRLPSLICTAPAIWLRWIDRPRAMKRQRAGRRGGDSGMALRRVLQLLRISGNWWSKCHSVENSHGLFALFSNNYDPRPLRGPTGQGFIFRYLWEAGAFMSSELQDYGGVICTHKVSRQWRMPSNPLVCQSG